MSTEKMIHWWSLIYANIRSSNRNFHTLTFSSCIHQISYHLFRLICQITMEAHRQWRVFTKWSLAQLTIDSNFHRTIIFNNETHFWMNGYVNKRDWICDDTKSHENLEHPIPPEKLSLWYRFRSGGSIGTYLRMTLVRPSLWTVSVFRQNYIAYHIAQVTLNILHQRFKVMVTVVNVVLMLIVLILINKYCSEYDWTRVVKFQYCWLTYIQNFMSAYE